MPAKTDLTITSNDNVTGKKVTDKISYVNPNITNSQAVTLAQTINALTKNTYTSTTRTDQTDCDIPKAARTVSKLRWESSSHAATNVPSDDIINITTADVAKGSNQYAKIVINAKLSDQLVMPTATISSSVSEETWVLTTVSYAASTNVYSAKDEWTITFFLVTGTDPVAQTVTIDITYPETNTSAAWQKTLTFNISDAAA